MEKYVFYPKCLNFSSSKCFHFHNFYELDRLNFPFYVDGSIAKVSSKVVYCSTIYHFQGFNVFFDIDLCLNVKLERRSHTFCSNMAVS